MLRTLTAECFFYKEPSWTAPGVLGPSLPLKGVDSTGVELTGVELGFRFRV